MTTISESLDRKSTRLNSSHQIISYAVFCLKKKKKQYTTPRGPSTSRPPHPATHCTRPRRAVGSRAGLRPLRIWHLSLGCFFFFFFNDTATTEIYTLSLHDALPISPASSVGPGPGAALLEASSPG